jgi:hypothetical protein
VGDRTPPLPHPDPLADGVAVDCWTPARGATVPAGVAGARTGSGTGAGADGSAGDDDADLAATLVPEPAVPGETAAVHTLVLRADGPVASIRVDYGRLDAGASSPPDLRVSTADGRTADDVAVDVAPDGTLAVALPEPETDAALFLEYGMTRNPSGDRHVVDVVVNGDRRTEARLTLLG